MKTRARFATAHMALVAPLLCGVALSLASCQQENVAPAAAALAQAKAESLGAATGALAYWKLDGNASDAVGTSAGTVVGATFGPGISGQALQFDGNDYVDIPAGRSANKSGSISLWVKTTQQTGRLLFNTEFTAAVPAAGVEARTSPMYLGIAKGKPQLYFGGVAGVGDVPFVLNGSRSVNDGRWHHMAATWAYSSAEGFRAVALYVDGGLVVNDETGPNANGSTLAPPSAGGFDFSRTIRLGASQSSINFFKGALDDVSIYNRTLTAAEVTALAARPVQ